MKMDEKLHFADFSHCLLDWYAGNARELPWRVGPVERERGARPDPYRVWLAEIMLQQTTVPHASRYYQIFLEKWPSVHALASASDEDVMAAWAGLGYYARARNLLKCAREVDRQGGWPTTANTLQKLPGIGPYTAGAVAALAFNEPAAAVDGNVDRVFARLLALKGEWKTEKRYLKSVVERLVPEDRPAEFAEALMDLGATICTPKSPNCPSCPVQAFCLGLSEGSPEQYPIKPKRPPKPLRRGHVYVSLGAERTVVTERRPGSGLLGGMMGLPTSAWSDDLVPPDYPSPADWSSIGEVRHVFTHFELRLQVWRAVSSREQMNTSRDDAVEGLPTVFAKALRLAMSSR